MIEKNVAAQSQPGLGQHAVLPGLVGDRQARPSCAAGAPRERALRFLCAVRAWTIMTLPSDGRPCFFRISRTEPSRSRPAEFVGRERTRTMDEVSSHVRLDLPFN